MAINNQPTIEPRTVTGIFTKYIAKTLPLAFDESMSYYECLCALLEYINTKVVPALDNNAEGLAELQEFYLELQNYVNTYFDNLDVQEEINNKLDQMIQDGTFESILINYFNFNGYIQPIFGGNIAIYNKQNYENLFNTCGECFNYLILDFHMVWDEVNSRFNLRTDYKETEEALNLVNTLTNSLVQNGVKIKACKFHSTKLSTLTSVIPETLLNAYQNAVEDILDHFTFDYDSIIILNEDDIVENTTYETLINNCISALRLKYSKTMSISKNGIYKIKPILSSIKDNLDFWSFNSYGNYSLDGETTTLENIAKHFDEIKSVAIQLKQTKPIILSEFGCRGSWESFHNAGTDYTDLGLSKPIALVVEAYFKSKLSCILDEAYYWYTSDAIKYIPNLLKNIKMKGSVRHG